MIVLQTKLTFEKVKSHLVHLHQLAKIDDHIVNEEKLYLYALGEKNGCDQILVDQIIIESEDHPFILPNNPVDRAIFLYEYIKMMLVDGKLDEREAKMCVRIAEKMNLKKSLVGALTNAIVSAAEDNTNPSLDENELKFYVNNVNNITL